MFKSNFTEAYNSNNDTVNVNIEMSGIASKGKFAPTLLIANNFGLTGNISNSVVSTAEINYKKNLKNNFGIDACMELATGINNINKIWLQQAYVNLNWKNLNLCLGSKERYGFPLDKNQTLTSGWLVEGPNARPIPQMRIGLNKYLNIPYTNGWISLKGHLAYGFFTDGKWQEKFVKPDLTYTKGTKYHSKSLMFKLGNREKFPVEFDFGLLMATQFGGDMFQKQSNGSSTLVVDMPDDLGSYWSAFFPRSGGKDTPEGEQVNVEGNMLGSWNFALNYYLDDWKIRATLEHYFEDHSQMFWQYGRWKDGLIGIEIYLPHNKWISSIVWEGISTKDSSGPILYDGFLGSFQDVQWSCGDDYYNNHIYQAWHHYGMGIGHPMLPSPIYNDNGQIKFKSNRMKGQHIGISGIPTMVWSWRLIISYAKHWGSYEIPFDRITRQFYGMAEINYTPPIIKNWGFKLALAIDRGQYPGNSTGAMMTINYKWNNK